MLPTAFISHGAPNRVLTDSPATQFLAGFSRRVRKPRAILILSAHWLTETLAITDTGELNPIYDFWGFPKELSEVKYPAVQPAWLTQTISTHLSQQGLGFKKIARGLDHGAWSILKLAYPDATIPIASLSIPVNQDTKDWNYYLKLGECLSDLRSDDILIIGSGSAVHNLQLLSSGVEAPKWGLEYVDWLQESVERHRYDELSAMYQSSPSGTLAHPTPEHYLPLLVAAGAAKNEASELIHDSWEWGSLNNSSFLFGE